MIKSDAIDAIFYDGQCVFRHMEEVRQHLETAICQQTERCSAAEFLAKHKCKVKIDCGEFVTGEQILKEENYTMETLQKMSKIINRYYKKCGLE